MPHNLNALIRYKTMDRLFRTGRRYTMEELIEHCSRELSEKRGLDRTISKRTIQNDIRVLRGDTLGFSAPIKNKEGMYFYSDPNYSITETRISSVDMLERVFQFLLKIPPQAVDSDTLYRLLADLQERIGMDSSRGSIVSDENTSNNIIEHYMPIAYQEDEEDFDETEEKAEKEDKVPDRDRIKFRRASDSRTYYSREPAHKFFTWGELLKMV